MTMTHGTARPPDSSEGNARPTERVKVRPDWASSYERPVNHHRLIVAIHRLAREQVAAKHVKMANCLGQAVEGVEIELSLCP